MGRWGLTPIKKRNQVLNGVKVSKEDFNLFNWNWGQTPSLPLCGTYQPRDFTCFEE